ncbi:MAG: hypothetical protein AAGA60_04310 [Cyanobacteria bacterium P01_E01_bin.42]
MKANVKDYAQSYQDFVSVVSAFSIQQGVAVGVQPMHNGRESEIVVVQNLLEALNLKGVCFSFDALHAQKKPSSKSSTVIMAVKANQPKLFNSLNHQFQEHVPMSVNRQIVNETALLPRGGDRERVCQQQTTKSKIFRNHLISSSFFCFV